MSCLAASSGLCQLQSHDLCPGSPGLGAGIGASEGTHGGGVEVGTGGGVGVGIGVGAGESEVQPCKATLMADAATIAGPIMVTNAMDRLSKLHHLSPRTLR